MRADPQTVRSEQPLNFGKLDQLYGLILYRTTVPAGPASDLRTEAAHDIGLVDLDGKRIGSFDRRNRAFWLRLPEREKPAELAILVEAMGRVNFGDGIHDRKGLHGPPRQRARRQRPHQGLPRLRRQQARRTGGVTPGSWRDDSLSQLRRQPPARCSAAGAASAAHAASSCSRAAIALQRQRLRRACE